MVPRTALLLLVLAGCRQDYKVVAAADEPLSLTVLTPTYGAYVDAEAVELTGIVSPPDAQVLVDGVTVPTAADGSFAATVPFAGRRGVAIHVEAIDPDEHLHEVVAAFDGVDPRAADPGAITGLLTPTGLDALEPLIAQTIDDTGWADQIAASLPALDTDWVDLVPTGVTTAPTTVDLSPGLTDLDLAVSLNEITIAADIVVLDSYDFPIEIAVSSVKIGAAALPAVDADGMITLTLSDAVAEVGDFTFAVAGYETPGWLFDYVIEPITDFVVGLGDLVLDEVLAQMGTLELGGPFAFETDLMGTALAARLVELDTSLDGVALGVTVSTEGDAADALPDVPALVATTPSGLPYQLGLGVHEGLLNTLIDETVAGLLDLDLQLEGEYGELLGSGIRALPGGYDIPDEADGYCIGFHAGDARVVRFAPGQGAPLANVWMPDVRVDIDYVLDGQCTSWLEASVFVVLALELDGTEVGLDLEVPSAIVLAYGAEDVDHEAVAESLGAVVQGLFGLFAGQLSFDLGDALGAFPVETDPKVVAVEPLDDEGLYGIYLDVFAAPTE